MLSGLYNCGPPLNGLIDITNVGGFCSNMCITLSLCDKYLTLETK